MNGPLKTVKVPKGFEPLFKKAHAFVHQYFSALKSNPARGTIEIFGQRYIFVRAASMSVEFFDLIKRAYEDRDEQEAIAIARNLLFDIAHAIGSADAREFHKRMKVKDPIARLSAGPIHFAYSGWAFVDIHPESKPTPDEDYYLVYDHPYSFESDSWKRAKRKVDFPVCVMNAGYSSGWCQESFGVELVATEISCKAKGDSHCRFIMAHPSRIEKYIKAYTTSHDLPSLRIEKYEIPGFFSRKTAEAELRKTLGEIDDRIAARTKPLEQANEQLRREIEERIRSEAALAQSEEKYRKLIDTASDAIFVADKETGIIMTVNQKAQELIGLPADKIIGMHQSQLHPPEEADLYKRIFSQFPLGGPLTATNLFAQHSSGRRIPIEISASICEINGRMSVQGIFRDVSVQRQTIEALRESEDRYKAFMEHSAEGIYRLEIEPPIKLSLDPDAKVKALFDDGYIAECNQVQARMYGFDDSKGLIGKKIRELLVPTDPDNVEYIRRFFETYRTKDEASHEVAKDGSDKYFLNNAVGIIENDRLVRIWGTQRDITDRMAADLALKQSEQRYRTLVESFQEMVLITSYDHKIVFANRSAERMSGFAAAQLQHDMGGFSHVHPDDRSMVMDAVEAFIGSSEAHSPVIENRYVTAAGDVRWHSTIISKAEYDGKPALQYLVRDITEKKRQQIETEIARANLRAIVDNTLDSIWSVDTSYRVVTINTTFQVAFELAYGFGLVPGSSILEHIPPEVRPVWEGRYKRALKGESFFVQDEISIQNQSRFFEISFNPIRTPDGGIAGAAMFSRDVTERRTAEIALRSSESRYRNLVETMNELVAEIDLRGKILFVNSSYERTGFEKSELLGTNFFDYIHPEDVEATIRHCGIARDESKPIRNCEYRFRKKNGEYIHLVTNGDPRFDENGHTTAILQVSFDITERKQAEEALEAEKERLSVTLRSIGDGVITTDASGKILFLNREAERLTGWSQVECEGKSISEVLNLIHERSRQRLNDPVSEIISDGGMVEIGDQTILVQKDGSEILISDSGAPIRDKDGRIIGVVLVFRNVTEKRKVEEERVKTMKLESVGVLAGGIAHDFNNLLTAILGNLSLAKLELDGDQPERVKDILTRSETASLRARDLTQQLLTFSRGGAPVRRVASVVNLIRESAEFMSHGSKVKALYDVPADLWPIDADQGQITQVVHNLVINAIQAMPDGGMIEVRARNLTVSKTDALALANGPHILIEVTDHGEGIPRAILSKIFDPYFTTKEKGSGLGLATCYSIVKRHEGLIEVQSEQGKGSTFKVYLPAVVGLERVGEELPPTITKGRGHILVMDDEADIREITGRILARLGYTSTVTADGREAVYEYLDALGQSKKFDAVIMDLTVPGGMGGHAAAEKILSMDPEARIVVASGYSNDPIMASYRSYGFCGVINKPFRIEDLQRVLAEVLNIG